MKLARFVASFALLLASLLPLSASADLLYLPIVNHGTVPVAWAELIVNGDFEAGNVGWLTYSELGRQVIVRLPSTMAAVLGNGSQDYIAQDVFIPRNTSPVQLRFRLIRLYLAQPMPCRLAVAITTPPDSGSVSVLFTEDALAISDGWHVYGPVDLSAHAGMSVRLYFLALSGCSGGFAIDDVSLVAPAS